MPADPAHPTFPHLSCLGSLKPSDSLCPFHVIAEHLIINTLA